MYEFTKLLRLIEDEIRLQEKLLDILGQERTAIVKLNQEQIEKVSLKNANVLAEAVKIGEKRDEVIQALNINKSEKEPIKLTEIIAACPSRELKNKLERAGTELKSSASSVAGMNSHNAELLKQSLGLVATIVSIFRSPPTADLPVYNEQGVLKSENAGVKPGRGTLVREA